MISDLAVLWLLNEKQIYCHYTKPVLNANVLSSLTDKVGSKLIGNVCCFQEASNFNFLGFQKCRNGQNAQIDCFSFQVDVFKSKK